MPTKGLVESIRRMIFPQRWLQPGLAVRIDRLISRNKRNQANLFGPNTANEHAS
jgi:hypothetical protein